MVRQNAAIAVVQWSGRDRQELTLPWTRIRTSLDAACLADASQLMPRAFVLSDTAPAEAILFALPLFVQVTDCKKKSSKFHATEHTILSQAHAMHVTWPSK